MHWQQVDFASGLVNGVHSRPNHTLVHCGLSVHDFDIETDDRVPRSPFDWTNQQSDV
jgi:hypothetical protein